MCPLCVVTATACVVAPLDPWYKQYYSVIPPRSPPFSYMSCAWVTALPVCVMGGPVCALSGRSRTSSWHEYRCSCQSTPTGYNSSRSRPVSRKEEPLSLSLYFVSRHPPVFESGAAETCSPWLPSFSFRRRKACFEERFSDGCGHGRAVQSFQPNGGTPNKKGVVRSDVGRRVKHCIRGVPFFWLQSSRLALLVERRAKTACLGLNGRCVGGLV